MRRKLPLPIKETKPSTFRFFRLEWLFFILVLTSASLYYYSHTQYPPLRPGILVPENPVLTRIPANKKPDTIFKNDYIVNYLAEFHIRGRVLGKHRYWWDKDSSVSPMDIILGWGQMSDQKIIDKIKFTLTKRTYSWSYAENLPISDDYILFHTTDLHLIPSSEKVKLLLKLIHINQIIDIVGYLVEIRGNDNYLLKGSVSMNDAGNDANKVVWVEDLDIEENP